MKNEAILILDFGSQYTQLIARRTRELNVYCEIKPYNTRLDDDVLNRFKGIILSGSPCSVTQQMPPKTDLSKIRGFIPILGICYGAQLLANEYGGKVEPSAIREYGRANLKIIQDSDLLTGLDPDSQIWMSHGDSISGLPEGAIVLAATESIPVAAFRFENEQTYGIQFHPEVTHTGQGKQLLSNFIIGICGCNPNWTPAAFVTQTIESLKTMLPDGNVVLGLSGGVDSSVAALLLHQAIGKRLFCIFVDSGLLRKDEFEQVIQSYHTLGLQVKGVRAKAQFFDNLKGISDPEAKRKAIGRVFIEVFEQEANQIPDVQYLAQGTIYPDVIESVSVNGPSVMIKSHHNVGGLPERMKLKIVEPLRMLFKDEVRRAGRQLQLPESILHRHPFPGPGLAIRILGEITSEKVEMLQAADYIFISLLQAHGLYDKVWQAGVILLPVYSVGVMGDERTYEQVVALRAVSSTDGMSADWVHLPYEFLALVSNQIINQVKGINRVVYDISSKPPATIEWE